VPEFMTAAHSQNRLRMSHISLIGSVLALVLMGINWGHTPSQPSWIVWMLLISVGLLIPLGERLSPSLSDGARWVAERCSFPLLLVLGYSLSQPPGLLTAALAGLWLAVRVYISFSVLLSWRTQRDFSVRRLCLDAASFFPAIGAAWLLANRLNWMPFGFDALIVLLTAAHFHHAGFTLPLIAGLCARTRADPFSKRACLLILAGVPLVAIGITCTHFKLLLWVEPVAVAVLVLGAFMVGTQQIGMAFHSAQANGSRCLFFISGLSLIIAMLLALSFGFRSILPQWALPMPRMWAIHGGLNTFGFGLCGILAWRSLERQKSIRL
jgi:hypothetical protein